MPTIDDAKFMARTMDAALRAKNVTLTGGECLDVVARQFGLKDWNVLSAQAKRSEASARRRIFSLKGWAFLAEHPDAYDHGSDADPAAPGGGSAVIRHDAVLGPRRYPEPSRAFGCYVQTVSARPFHTKRAEIGAKLRCQDVSHGATLWARIDGMPGHTFAFDPGRESPIAAQLKPQPLRSRLLASLQPAIQQQPLHGRLPRDAARGDVRPS